MAVWNSITSPRRRCAHPFRSPSGHLTTIVACFTGATMHHVAFARFIIVSSSCSSSCSSSFLLVLLLVLLAHLPPPVLPLRLPLLLLLLLVLFPRNDETFSKKPDSTTGRFYCCAEIWSNRLAWIADASADTYSSPKLRPSNRRRSCFPASNAQVPCCTPQTLEVGAFVRRLVQPLMIQLKEPHERQNQRDPRTLSSCSEGQCHRAPQRSQHLRESEALSTAELRGCEDHPLKLLSPATGAATREFDSVPLSESFVCARGERFGSLWVASSVLP